MQEDIVAQGVELMLYGMGTVVLFLALLVVVTTAMSWLVGRYFPEPVVAAASPAHKAQGRAPQGDDPNLVAAISAAIHRHRANRK